MDKAHGPPTVTGASYLEMVKEVLPEVRGRASQRRWWWQQDGAGVHCTDAVINFLNAKFHGRVITRRGEHPWPPFSPDLLLLDYYFWGFANAAVWRQKPMKAVLKEVAASLNVDVLRSVRSNFRKRAETCLTMEGGHFEYALDLFK